MYGISGSKELRYFFSYLGVSLVAYYTGIARTNFIIYDTIVLIMVNIILNWIFIFGKFGIQPMGIKGAALASTLAEVVAFIVFIIYIFMIKSTINTNYGNLRDLTLL